MVKMATVTLAEIFSSTFMHFAGSNTIILALLLLGLFGFMMYKFKIPAAFSVVLGIGLFVALATLSPIFQSLTLILIGLTGIGFVILILRFAGR